VLRSTCFAQRRATTILSSAPRGTATPAGGAVAVATVASLTLISNAASTRVAAVETRMRQCVGMSPEARAVDCDYESGAMHATVKVEVSENSIR